MNVNYNISTNWAIVLAVLAVWELVWKAIALWKASRKRQLGWFVLLLVINSVGILPILYILVNKNSPRKDKISHD